MQNLANLQLIKEQVKLKSLELRKVKEEKEKSINNLVEMIANNRLEINNLKAVIKKREEEFSQQPSPLLQSRRSGFSATEDGSRERLEFTPADLELDTGSASNSISAPLLKKKIQSLKELTQFLKSQFEIEKQKNIKFQKDHRDIHAEMIRLRSEAGKSKDLQKKMETLQSQLKQAKTTTLATKRTTQQVVEEKKGIIKKYETFLYGDGFTEKPGIPPATIIKEMKVFLDKMEGDNLKLTQEMEFLERENGELESKILFLEEKEILDTVEYKPEAENRVAVTAEFSSGLDSFLITYSDLITLILVIFVLLYSLSTIDSEKFQEAFSSFQEQEFQHTTANVRLTDDEMQMLKRVRELVKDNVDPESLVRSDVRTVLIRLKSSDLFEPGSAELIPGAEDLILSSLKEEMQDGVKQVHVDGHTDDVPMKVKDKFPSNWELSSVRAAHVGRVIIDKFRYPPERMVVTGYAEYRPVKPNNSDKNRAINRRVEIKILKDLVVADDKKNPEPPEKPKAKPGFGKNLTGPILSSPQPAPQNP